MTSIKDVAKAAGVSTATISRAINKKSVVSKKTLEKIENAIQKIGFVPSESAKWMKNQYSTLIPLFLETEMNKNHLYQVVNVIIPFLERYNFSLVMFSTSTDFLNAKNIAYALSLKPKFVLVLSANSKIIKLEKEFKKQNVKMIKLDVNKFDDEKAVLKQLSIIKK